MSVVYLTGEEILLAGSVAYESPLYVGDQAQFEANVARPAQSAFGEDAYPGIWLKAAALLHAFATTQSLLDGNKRTGWAAAWLMLRINRASGPLRPGALNDDDAERFVRAVANNQFDVSQISTKLRQLDSSARLPEGFCFTAPPQACGDSILIGRGVLADGSQRVYIYMGGNTGAPRELLLTAEQAKEFATHLIEVADGETRSLYIRVEHMILHGDFEIPPSF